jgi:hypothetical protein
MLFLGTSICLLAICLQPCLASPSLIVVQQKVVRLYDLVQNVLELTVFVIQIAIEDLVILFLSLLRSCRPLFGREVHIVSVGTWGWKDTGEVVLSCSHNCLCSPWYISELTHDTKLF